MPTSTPGVLRVTFSPATHNSDVLTSPHSAVSRAVITCSRHSPTNANSASGINTYAARLPWARRAALRVVEKSTKSADDAAPGTRRARSLRRSWARVSSVDPVSSTVHASTWGAADAAVRAMEPPSLRTIMARPREAGGGGGRVCVKISATEGGLHVNAGWGDGTAASVAASAGSSAETTRTEGRGRGQGPEAVVVWPTTITAGRSNAGFTSRTASAMRMTGVPGRAA